MRNLCPLQRNTLDSTSLSIFVLYIFLPLKQQYWKCSLHSFPLNHVILRSINEFFAISSLLKLVFSSPCWSSFGESNSQFSFYILCDLLSSYGFLFWVWRNICFGFCFVLLFPDHNELLLLSLLWWFSVPDPNTEKTSSLNIWFSQLQNPIHNCLMTLHLNFQV